MLSARWRRVALPAIACLMAACNSGDDDGSGRPQPRPVVGVPAEEAVCGAADLSALKTHVHVSPQGSDGAGCGQTGATACKTIQQGIANCAAAGCGVLVRWGLYPTSATIELRDAVNVYGGCLFDGEPARGYRTTVQASPAPGTPAVSASGIHTATLFSGIVVIGKNETAAGAASLTMVVADSKGLALSQTVLVSGTGGDGENGGAAAAAARGHNGLDGNFGDIFGMRGGAGAGGPACNGSTTAGAGGTGADYRLLIASGCVATCVCAEYQGDSGSSGADAGNAKGGAGGGAGSRGLRCEGTHGEVAGPGVQGGAGARGACAASAGVAAANPWGSLGPAGWSPGVGGTGAAGDMGSGGGGGGAGGVCVFIPLLDDGNGFNSNGMPGGGGGGGGCGGPGGQGGQQGGASIPLLLSGSALAGADASLSLVAGPPGKGGHGGSGSAGGSGGHGGSTPFRGTNPVMTACKFWNKVNAGYGGDGGPGGDGGRGGAGSGGPGGSGGASIGVALRAASTAPAAAIVYPTLPGGASGSGGAGGQNAPIPNVDPSPCGGVDGQAGLQGGSAAVVDFDLPLASMLLPGQQLPKSYSIRSPNGNVQFVMQSDDNLCLYASGNPVWCTQTVAKEVPAALMQTDGNFCIYPAHAATWCTATESHPGAHLIVQDSGHVQIIAADNTVLWSNP